MSSLCTSPAKQQRRKQIMNSPCSRTTMFPGARFLCNPNSIQFGGYSMKHAAMRPNDYASSNARHSSNGACSNSVNSASTDVVLESLRSLRAQVDRLENAIVRVSHKQPTQTSIEGKPSADTIRRIIRARMERTLYFRANIFADPAWDILLDLYAAELSQVRVSVNSLCIASNVPQTTALRWINSLEAEQLIKRSPDPLDRRRFFLSLTQSAVNSLEEYFTGPVRMAVI